jgi:hypothetical protein
VEFNEDSGRLGNVNDDILTFAGDAGSHDATITIAERQLLVALVVVFRYNGREIMQADIGPETDPGLLLPVLTEMFKQDGYLDQVMDLDERK